MLYYSFNNYLQKRYGARVQRLSLDAGFTCPNRDGTLGTGGCIYCSDEGFSPFAGKGKPLKEQIEESMVFARKRYGAEKFIAYFQGSTGTYGETAELKAKYDVIKDHPDVVGLFISTRPDCVDDERLDLIESYSGRYEVWVEYGFQTIHERTLKLVKRGHTFRQSADSIKKTAQRGIKVGVHVILGLPGESAEDMLRTAEEISKLPVSGIKFHVLHVLKGTPLEDMYKRGEVPLMPENDYISIVCDFLENTGPDCVIFRLVSDARKDVLVAPSWINDKQRVIKKIEKELSARGTFQGYRIQATAAK